MIEPFKGALMKTGLRSPKWRGIDSKDTLSIFGLYDSVEKGFLSERKMR